jgi:hypothetical protein
MLMRSVSTHASTSHEKINPFVHLSMEDNLLLVCYTFSRNENTDGSARRRPAASAHTSSTWSSRSLRNFLVQGGKVMNLPPILIVGLVLAALLYAVAMLLYRRRGMSTQRWYTTIGTAIVTLLVFALLGSIFPSAVGAGTLAALAIIGAAITLGFAWLRRPQTR